MMLFWWSCRSLSTQFNIFSLDTKFVIGLKENDKVVLNFIIPWWWQSWLWLLKPAWSWPAGFLHNGWISDRTAPLEASSPCWVVLPSSGSFQHLSSQYSHWQPLSLLLLDDKMAGKLFGTLGLAKTIRVVKEENVSNVVQNCLVTCHHPCWCKYKRDFILFIRACVI